MEVEAQAWSSPEILRTQFETETSELANETLGAYAMQPLGADLLIGIGNSPGRYDGALITRAANGSTFTTERTLDEQGAHDMQIVAGRVFVPGTDPTDDWSLGNLYERNSGGVWTKRRTQPNVIHSLGLWHDGSHLYVSTGAHTGDSITWSGRVLRSSDDGSTWDQNVEVNDYRVHDIIGHAGRLYATGYGFDAFIHLYTSTDGGLTWTMVAGVTPRFKARMIVFGSTLIVGGTQANLYQIDGSHVITERVLGFTLADQWNALTTDGTYLYTLDGSGSVWRAADFTHWYNWTRYTYVAGAVSICWWAGVGLMVSDSGLSARIWKA